MKVRVRKRRSKAANMNVERVLISSLHLDPANARSHGPGNMEAIVGSLKRFGQAEPLVVQAKSNRVIGGNGRLVAMKELGWTSCDVVRLDVDDLEATALGIALNRTSELAEWDDATLAKLLDELRNEDALEGVGYSGDDIDALLDELEGDADPKDVDDQGPEEPPEVPISQVGGLWILGDHKILCGDSTDPLSYERLLGKERPALLSTDPPYCVDYTGADRPNGSGKDWSDKYDEVSIPDLGDFLRSVFKAALPHLAKHVAIYVWHAHKQYPVVATVFEEFDLLLHQAIIWAKPSSTFGHSFYRWRHEPCAFGWKRGNKPHHAGINSSTDWEVDWEGKARVVGNEHPTQKPVRLFEIPMEMHTKPRAIVLEPFSGSGSQLIAAEKLGRRCRAMEISPGFVDVAIKRWQTATDEEAVLDGDGRTFAEIAGEREE